MTTDLDMPIFFIIGKGRSGTTLLQNLLDANENTLVPIESTFLVHLYGKYGGVRNWNKKIIDNYVDDLFLLRKIRESWNLNPTTLKQKINAYLVENGNLYYATISKIIYLSFQSIHPKEKILIIGDKNPFYTFCIEDLLNIFPEAKFIHLIRDPRANVRSHMISFDTNFITFIAWKWRCYNKEIESKKLKYPNHFHELKYEDLVTTPEATLIKVCDFLNIDFNPNALEFHQQVKGEFGDIKKYKSGFHANLKKPIDKSLSVKWKEFFNKKQLKIINSICGDYLQKYNYEYEPSSITSNDSIGIWYGKICFKMWFSVVYSFYQSPFWVKKIAFSLIKLAVSKNRSTS
jgi:hypothetical protein